MMVAQREVSSQVLERPPATTVAIDTVPKEPEVLERILAFRSLGVSMRIAKELGIPIEEAEELFMETLKYLYVCRQARKVKIPVSPSLVLDEGWHTFILFTKEYARFCEECVGEFIHHVPDMGEPNPERYFISRQVAEFLLGPLKPEIWPERSAANCCQSVSCGSECQAPCGSDEG